MTNEEIKEKNIQKTIEAGIQCFLEDGIANTQIASVAEKSGLSKRSFLRYFGSKDNFVTAVLKNINIGCYNIGRECYRTISEKYDAAPDRLRVLMEVTGEYFLAHPEIFILLSEGQAYVEHSMEKGNILEQYTRLWDYWPSVVLSLLKQGAAEGSITCFPEEYIQKNESNALWYAYIGLLLQLAYARTLGNYSNEDCAETIRRFIQQSIQSLN